MSIFGRTNDKEHNLGKTIYMEIINKHYNNMKRDQSISRIYLPPRVRVVEVSAEQSILQVSRVNLQSRMSVDELESKGLDDTDERYWFE